MVVERGGGVKRGFPFMMREITMCFYSDRNGPKEKGKNYNAGVRKDGIYCPSSGNGSSLLVKGKSIWA